MSQFIRSYPISGELCDSIKSWFDLDRVPKFPGKLYDPDLGKPVVDFRKRCSVTELQGSLLDRYFQELQRVLDLYIKDLPQCAEYASFAVMEGVYIQWYKPGEGYDVWHTERGSGQEPVSRRHLVFMTYLTDVTDDPDFEGGTEWLHQDHKIRCRRGQTVFWPADWTHAHRGIPHPTEHKYIATGWLSYED